MEKTQAHPPERSPSPAEEPVKPSLRRRSTVGRQGQRGRRRSAADKRQKDKKRGPEQKEGVTVKRTWSGGKRRWDKKHYCVFCRRPQVKIARHLLRKHADQQEVMAASSLPAGSKQRHVLLEHLRCRGNYLHNIEVIRQGSGEIVPCRQPSEEVDARSYLPCPLCLGFFLRADLWKHQASCRKKLASDVCRDPSSAADALSEPLKDSPACSPTVKTTQKPPEEMSEPSAIPPDDTGVSDTGTRHPLTSDLSTRLNVTSVPALDLPRKRTRVQAAASRLLPISSGASESCSEVLHRMNLDHVSHQVKSDWLICKYGNKLMGNQDGNQRRYDYVSQKLRELGRFLLAAKSLDSKIHTLQDVLAPGRLSLALTAARKASGYRWSRPPLAVKTTLKTVCEIAIGESLQDGAWEAAAKTTEFYHMLGQDWDDLELLDHHLDTDAPVEEPKLKKQPRNKRKLRAVDQDQSDFRPEGLSKSSDQPVTSVIPLEAKLQTPVSGPLSVPKVPKKVGRCPWSTAEKEAVWRQLGVHVLFQSVPGKEVCQRCLDLEPVLRGRHWKDIKNQVHNQIQSQKKQQFLAQMDLQEQQDQGPNYKLYHNPLDQQGKIQLQNQKKNQCHSQIDDDQNNLQNQSKQQYPVHMDHQQLDQEQQYQAEVDHQNHPHKKQCQTRLEHQDHLQVQKKQLYPPGQLSQGLQAPMDRDVSVLPPYGPNGPHRATGHSLVERDPNISLYPLPQSSQRPHIDQILGRTEWTDGCLAQTYPIRRHMTQNLLEGPLGAPLTNSESGHVHF